MILQYHPVYTLTSCLPLNITRILTLSLALSLVITPTVTPTITLTIILMTLCTLTGTLTPRPAAGPRAHWHLRVIGTLTSAKNRKFRLFLETMWQLSWRMIRNLLA